jgi:hypothetical protein
MAPTIALQLLRVNVDRGIVIRANHFHVIERYVTRFDDLLARTKEQTNR